MEFEELARGLREFCAKLGGRLEEGRGRLACVLPRPVQITVDLQVFRYEEPYASLEVRGPAAELSAPRLSGDVAIAARGRVTRVFRSLYVPGDRTSLDVQAAKIELSRKVPEGVYLALE